MGEVRGKKQRSNAWTSNGVDLALMIGAAVLAELPPAQAAVGANSADSAQSNVEHEARTESPAASEQAIALPAEHLVGGKGADVFASGGDAAPLVGFAFRDDLGGSGKAHTAAGSSDAIGLHAGAEFSALTMSAGATESAHAVALDAAPQGTPGNDTLHGTDGNDVIYGGAGDDTIFGGRGNDRIYGGAGNDRLHGGDGNDVLVGGAGADQLDGGAGKDTADYSSSREGVTVDLASSRGSHGDAQGDSYHSIEKAVGSDHDDTLIGASDTELLSGGKGNDTLIATGGDTTMQGGAGADNFVLAPAAGSSSTMPAQASIADFSQADHDTIDVSALAPAGSAFAFAAIDADTSSGSPAIHYALDAAHDHTVVTGDDASGHAVFELQLNGLVHLGAGDFHL